MDERSVLKIIKNIKFDKIYTIREDSKSYHNLVEKIKDIIDKKEDIDNGFVITFNNSYNAIKKHRHFFK